MSNQKQRLVNQIFQDIALLLAGVIALRHREISDAVVWEIAGDLKRLHNQYIKETKEKEAKVDLRPHPAIAELIKRTRIL